MHVLHGCMDCHHSSIQNMYFHKRLFIINVYLYDNYYKTDRCIRGQTTYTNILYSPKTLQHRSLTSQSLFIDISTSHLVIILCSNSVFQEHAIPSVGVIYVNPLSYETNMGFVYATCTFLRLDDIR